MEPTNSTYTSGMNGLTAELKPYATPVLKNAGNLAELTQGFSGSVPDEQGGRTKRNPFQG